MKDINPVSGSFPPDLLDLDGTLFFSAEDLANGRELWRSDGTAAGTTLVRNINPASGIIGGPYRLTLSGGKLFFGVDDGIHGYDLWALQALFLPATVLPGAAVGTAYSQSLPIQGATGGTTLVVTAGSLPPGVGVSDAGVLSGTPTAVGTLAFTLRVRDAGGQSTTRDYSLIVAPRATATTATVATATLGPAGLSVTLTGGVTSGVAVSGGTFSFAVFRAETPVGSAVTSGPVVAGSASATLTLPAGLAAGVYTIVTTYSGGPDLATSTNRTGTLSLPALRLTAVGSPAGLAPSVTVSNADGCVRLRLVPFESGFRGGVSVAVADVTGDGSDDIVTWAGPTGGPRVTVYCGLDGSVVANFFAFDPSYRGGVNVAVAMLDGGASTILATPGVRGGPILSAFTGTGRPGPYSSGRRTTAAACRSPRRRARRPIRRRR